MRSYGIPALVLILYIAGYCAALLINKGQMEDRYTALCKKWLLLTSTR